MKKSKSKEIEAKIFTADRCERIGSNYIACVAVSNDPDIAIRIADRIIDRLQEFKAREHQGND